MIAPAPGCYRNDVDTAYVYKMENNDKSVSKIIFPGFLDCMASQKVNCKHFGWLPRFTKSQRAKTLD